MDERTYGNFGRHELGSSYSALDGVPFKIGRAFQKPEQVVTPQLTSSRTAEVLSQEYTFETEEAVLAWAKAREEAAKKAAEEHAQKVAEEETKKAAEELEIKAATEEAEQLKLAEEQQKNKAEQSEASKTVQNGSSPSNSNDTKEINVYDIPRFSLPPQKNGDSQIKPPLPPKVSGLSAKANSEPGAVLTPTPIKPPLALSLDNENIPTSTVNSNSKADTQFDLAMFEAEADPFDNLELQTLNDMEELKILLDSNSVQTNNKLCQGQDKGIEASESCEVNVDSSGDKTKISTNMLVSDEPSENKSNPENDNFERLIDQGKNPSSSEIPSQSCDEGEYVEITRKYKKDTATPQNTPGIIQDDKLKFVNGVAFHKPNLTQTGAFPVSAVNTQIYKPVLPPIAKPGHITDSCVQHQSAPVQQPLPAHPSDSMVHASSTQPWNHSPAQNSGKALPLRQPNGRVFASPSPPPSSSGFVSASPPPTSQAIKPSRPAPPPPVAPRPIPAPRNNKPPIQGSDPMSVSSGPSLAKFLGDSGQSDERSLKNTYSRHCISTSDLNSDSTTHTGPDNSRRNSAGISPQPWNRHVPLPPTAHSSYSPSCLPAAQPVGLSDPYSNLSREEREFTDILTNMGFLRPRVARAVQKFGTKEKEVLDHLLAVDKLGEQSYAPVMIESALFTFKNDVEKAEKFLQLYAQFEELGFQQDKIRDALVSTDLQHDKALDILTA